jgi:hypothetical protein
MGRAVGTDAGSTEKGAGNEAKEPGQNPVTQYLISEFVKKTCPDH